MRLPGFEPEIVAWEATVIPLDYNRKLSNCAGIHQIPFPHKSSSYKGGYLTILLVMEAKIVVVIEGEVVTVVVVTIVGDSDDRGGRDGGGW